MRSWDKLWRRPGRSRDGSADSERECPAASLLGTNSTSWRRTCRFADPVLRRGYHAGSAPSIPPSVDDAGSAFRRRRRQLNGGAAGGHSTRHGLTATLLGAFLTTTLVPALSAPRAAAALDEVVTLDGVSGVRPGLSLDAVQERWGFRPSITQVSPGCASVVFRQGPIEGFVLFLAGPSGWRFGSVSFSKGVRTGLGVGIGTSRESLRQAYGNRLKFRPNLYVPGGRDYFVTRARKPHWLLRFDVSPAGRVTAIAFGNHTVAWPEGCA